MTNQMTDRIMTQSQPHSPAKSVEIGRWPALAGGVIGPIVFTLAYTLDDALAGTVGLGPVGFAVGMGLTLRPVLGRGWRCLARGIRPEALSC